MRSADEAQADRLRSLVPAALKADVNFQRGPVAREAQSGVVAGDYVDAGNIYYTSGGYAHCTFGFAGRSHEGKDIILTASDRHCSARQPYHWLGHWVILPLAYTSRSETASGMTYDFRAHVITGLDNGPWVYYKNNKQVTGYQYINTVAYLSDWGHFLVTGSLANSTSSNWGHPEGMTICKMGQTTGITCGIITEDSASGVDSNGSFYGLVRVGRSNQKVIAFSGDSGGPTFTAPDTTNRVRAAGIIKSAEAHSTSSGPQPCVTNTAYDCGYYYMPIDRINDVLPMQIKTETGTVSP